MPFIRSQLAQDKTLGLTQPQVGGYDPTVAGPPPDVYSSHTVLKKSTSYVGVLSQLHVERELLKRGCQVFRPIVDDGEIDLIALCPSGRFWRIQVKTAQYLETVKKVTSSGRVVKKECISATTRRRGERNADGTRNRDKRYTQIDVFVLVYQEACWVVPFSQAGTTKKRCGMQSPNREAWHLMGLA